MPCEIADPPIRVLFSKDHFVACNYAVHIKAWRSNNCSLFNMQEGELIGIKVNFITNQYLVSHSFIVAFILVLF